MMAGNFNRGGAAPYRSRNVLSTRPVEDSSENQLRMLDDMADQQPKDIAETIETAAKFRDDFLNPLQKIVTKGRPRVKNNARKPNKIIIQHGSRKIIGVISLGLVLFFVVYVSVVMFWRLENEVTSRREKGWFPSDMMMIAHMIVNATSGGRTLNKSIIRYSSSNVVTVVAFTLLLVFIVYAVGNVPR